MYKLGLALLLLSSTPGQHRGLGVPLHKGCPGNALCSRESGELRLRWKELLMKSRKHPKRTEQLEAFRRRHGIPLEAWTPKTRTAPSEQGDGKAKRPLPGVHHDSLCPDSPWMLSEIFAPDLTKLTQAIPRQGHLLKKNSIETWILPRGDVPLYENNKRLYYNRLFEGEYYGISIGRKGDIRMEKLPGPKKPYDFPETTPCPQKLLDYFAKKNPSTRPDSHPRCLRLPSTSQSPLILLLGKECQ